MSKTHIPLPEVAFEAILRTESPFIAAEMVRTCARGRFSLTDSQEVRATDLIAKDPRAADRVVGGPHSVAHLISPTMSEALFVAAQPHENYRFIVYGSGYMVTGLIGFIFLLAWHAVV